MSCNWEPWINPLLLLHYWKNLSNLGENVWIANDGVERVFSFNEAAASHRYYHF